MAPRAAQANGQLEGLSSSSSVQQMDLASERLAQGIATWDVEGQQQIKKILFVQSELEASLASTIPLSNTMIALLQSSIPAPRLTEWFKSVVEELEDERKEILWEALVDAVSVLADSQEDMPDSMEVEGQDDAAQLPGDKGVEIIRSLLASGDLPVSIPSLTMSLPTLQGLGLLGPHNESTFNRAQVRRQTALGYKQSKYNLLRESSEGFSGLIVLLTSGDALADDALNESAEATKARAKRVWSKVMGLIGYFNLSPPRVLDIILEIASCQVTIHWRFWLELIRCSPWGGADKNGKGKEKAEGSWAEQELQAVAGALDWEGDRVLAQVLGAKFSFCQRPDGGNTPRGLVYIAALLVKHGFVGLADLLPFLSPDDDEMDNIRKRFLDSTTARSGPNNALANTILADDEPPSSAAAKDAEPTGPPAKPPPEQRIQLAQALLSLGDISAAQYFLAKYPWIAQSHPDIADLILRLIANALEDLFKAEVTGLEQVEGDSDIDMSASTSTKEVVPTLYAPSPPETATKVFQFFYPGWREGAEKWTSPADIHEKGMRWFSLVRGMGGRAGSVMAKICRIATKHFAQLKEQKIREAGLSASSTVKDVIRQSEPSPAEMEPWLNVIRVLLLPALSNSNMTAAFDIDLWALIKHFPYPVRYQLYGEWRDFTCDPKKVNFNCPIAVKAAADCTRDIKKALSRVTASQSSSVPSSQERGPARALAKLSHSNPCALWSTAVTQVKAYPNIGASIVDAGRYMNQLSMDVATFTLVDVLASEKASRTNPQGTEVAQWLENIASFVGDFNRRYLTMDLEPILQYIINKLMRGESDDLTILSRVIQRMYGVDTVENNGVSDAQLEAYATGKHMVHESFWTTQILLAKPTDDPGNKSKNTPMDKAKSTKKSLPRLINALRDTKLAVPIWIALAQTRQGVVDKIVEKQPDAPLKALGLMHDKVHDIFVQYGDLLGDQLHTDELINLIPDFATLTEDFGLDYSMVFQVLRARLRVQIVNEDNDKLALLRERLKAQKEASAAGAGGTVTPPLSPTPVTPPLSAVALPSQAGDDAQPNGESVPEPKVATQRPRYQAALLPTIEQAANILTDSAKLVMGAPFFVVYWHLATSDITFSAATYKSAIARITTYDKEIASWRGGNLSQQKEERKRLKDQIDVLIKERDAQSSYVERTRKRLRLEAPSWFDTNAMDGTGRLDLALQLHQFCFYPRALLTPSDAVFVAKMIRTMHDLGTPGFNTVFAYMQFFGDSLPSCIFACTESEARNLARCLKAILVDLDAWYKDQKKYEQEGLGMSSDPGSTSAQLPGMMYRPHTGGEFKHMPWTAFRIFNMTRLHSALFRAIKSCWQQTDFMHIKNGITVALQVLPIFPLLDDHGHGLFEVMEELEKRTDLTPDLKQGCRAYMVQLQKRITVRPYIKTEDFSANAKTPAKAPPSGPAKPAANGEPSKSKATNGTSGPSTATTAKLDQEALRKRVQESKAKAAAKPAASAKEGRSSAPPAGPSEKQGASAADADKGRGDTATQPPPAGPRATRSTASVPPTTPAKPGAPNGRTNGTPEKPSNAPTGPSKAASNLPQKPSAQSMGPPRTMTPDEERAAARARRFGSLVSEMPSIRGAASAQSASASTAAAESAGTRASPAIESPRTKKEESPMLPPSATSSSNRENDTSRPASPPLPSSRRGSPKSRSHRSGSVESRTSDRSRRDRSGRDRDRDRGDTAKVNGPAGDSDRKKQEDLLQARHDRLAAEPSVKDERRSSGSKRESTKERAERKAKEQEEKDKDGKDEAGQKRKRDEAPRRIDPVEKPGDRRREREERDRERDHGRDRDRDRNRDRSRDRDRRSHRSDDPRDRDRRIDDPRDRDRDRRGGRDDPRDRDRERDRDRDRDRDRRGPNDREERPDDRDRDRGDRPRDGGRELMPLASGANAGAPGPSRDIRPRGPSGDLPPGPADRDRSGPGLVAAPLSNSGQAGPGGTPNARDMRSNENNGNGRPPHGLPQRPSSRNERSAPAVHSANADRPSGSLTPGSLASRMGINTASGPGGQASPAPRPASPPLPGTDDSDRKRPHDEAPAMIREGSADAKRRKLDRDRGRRPMGGRMLADAMKAANDK